MGNRIEKNMSVGVTANTDQFNKAMSDMRRHINYAQKATTEASEYMAALAKATEKEQLTAEQLAIVMRRLNQQLEKNKQVIDEERIAVLAAQKAYAGWDNGLKRINQTFLAQEAAAKRAGKAAFDAGLAAMTAAKQLNAVANAAWEAGLKRVHATALAIERSDPFAAGLGNMARQNAARADAAKAAAEARRLGLLARTGGPGRQAFFDALDDAAAQTNARENTALARTGRGGRNFFLEELDEITGAQAAARADRNALTRQGVDYMAQFGNTRQRAMAEMREARSMFKQGAIDAEQYMRAISGIRDRHSLLQQSFSGMREALLTMIGPLVIAYQAWNQFTTAIQKTSELEMTRAKFTTFLGSDMAAGSMIEQIRELTRSSPISFEGGARATSTLLQFGVAANQVIPALTSIAEITGGNQEQMENLALAYAQSQAAGRLMGQELLQMVNAGFNPLKVISEETGESMASLKHRMEEGEISAQMVSQAFQTATEEGGRFHGMLDRIAGTMAGKLARAQSALQEAQISFGQSMKSEANILLDSYTALTRAVTTLHSHMMTLTPTGLMDYMSGNNDEGSSVIGGYVEAANAARSIEDSHKAFIAMVNALGGKEKLSDELKRQYDFSVDILAVLEQQRLEQERIGDLFSTAFDKEQEKYLNLYYGDRADEVALILESMVGEEREKANLLVSQGGTYEQLYALISESAKAELDRVLALKAQNDELEAFKQGQEELDRARKEREREEKRVQQEKQRDKERMAQSEMDAVFDNIDDERKAKDRLRKGFEEDAKRIRQKGDPTEELSRLMAMQSMGLISDADFNRERASLLSDSNAAARSVSAPSAVQAGSAEVVSILANLQVQAVSEQQRLADRAAKLQKITADATSGMFKILDEIRDDLVTGNAP